MRTSLSLRTLLLAALLLLPAATGAAQDLLNPLFQDHAVLQRDTPIRVWGTAAPGETVTVTLAEEEATGTADASGNWTVQLPPMAAGGPHVLTARSSGGAQQQATDVLIGDVFLCSGQSNMELPVSRTLDAPAEIGRATHERIRMLTSPKATSPTPLADWTHEMAWERATPATVANWSGTCYYFARELQPHTDVPVGLVHSSWGGSNIRAWMDAAALTRAGGYDDALTTLRLYGEDERAAQQALGAIWEAWWRERTGDTPGAEPWQPAVGAAWPLAPEALGDWKAWDDPDLKQHYGTVWHRATFTLTETQAAKDATLSLGGIDEVDQTWLNGQIVGNTFGWGTERNYTIPAALLRAGENVVVVNVLNTYGPGGMVGEPARRALVLESREQIPLAAWRYQPVPPQTGQPPSAPWTSVGGLTTLHNAMVAPLREFGLRGAIWYQGESNTGESDSYQRLLRALMGQWRGQFGPGLPVLVVQLANYGRPATSPTESGWAEVREAQRRATQEDPNAALAVTIDIGDLYDIHPPNKQELGRRLARAARHLIYGESLSPSGPVPLRADREGDAVVLTFGEVEGALVARGNTMPIGFELCGEAAGSCAYATASIEGNRVWLRAEAGQAFTRVRYCWADSPTCTLYDATGLPAGPFELPLPR